MFLQKNTLNTGVRLTALVLAGTLAGCSLNPFAGDDEPSQPIPVGQTSQPRNDSMADSSVQTSAMRSEPVVQRMGDEVPLASGHPDEYVVQVGDTLWDISARFLRDPWYWPEIWHVNPDIVNPHLIYPGDVLALVYIDGVPRITNVRGSTYRMSPQARVTPLSEAITTIPYDAISSFLNHGMILDKSQIDSLPYVLSSRGEHLIAAAGNQVYVRGVGGDIERSNYSVIEIGDELVDPDNNDVVGYHGIFIGEGFLERGGDPGTVALTDTNREVVQGDRLVPTQVDIPLTFYPSAPSTQVNGRIMAVVDGVTQIGQYHVVILNRGSNHGVGVGNVLTVYQSGEEIHDRIAGGTVKLPDEEAGTIMVFKVFDRISYALVMEAHQAIHVLDTVTNPR